ncbi:LysR family transcriptional regulator [Romboutsia sp.]|uniref:LysR family transcriptional regulator n=1 Tax=Romboutsia sp. TaxID=1965302 RepID=UPI003F3F99F7
MDIRNFITFNSVVEVGGFTKAATYLNYAQSTVTLHIKELESHYNEQLFDRIGKKNTLTPFGEKLYEKTKGLVEQYQYIIEMNNKNKPVEVLRIGVYESLLKYRLYDLINEYKYKHPNVDIILQHGNCVELRDMVLNGKLDLTFHIEEKQEYLGLVSKILCEEKFSIIFPKDNGIDMLYEHNHTVYLTEKGCSYRKVFEAYLIEKDAIWDRIIETGSIDMIKQYVSIGLGYSLVPSITVKDEGKRLNIIDLDTKKILYTQVVYHKNKNIFPSMKEFIDLVEFYSKDWK